MQGQSFSLYPCSVREGGGAHSQQTCSASLSIPQHTLATPDPALLPPQLLPTPQQSFPAHRGSAPKLRAPLCLSSARLTRTVTQGQQQEVSHVLQLAAHWVTGPSVTFQHDNQKDTSYASYPEAALHHRILLELRAYSQVWYFMYVIRGGASSQIPGYIRSCLSLHMLDVFTDSWKMLRPSPIHCTGHIPETPTSRPEPGVVHSRTGRVSRSVSTS